MEPESKSCEFAAWEKICSCKGKSSMPQFTDSTKRLLTGNKYTISLGLIEPPVCNKCRKSWKLIQ